jgi:LysR family hydrogen peroxide-inducible transcriptional activator
LFFTPLGLDLVERTPMSGPLRLGIIPTIGRFLLPRLMPVLRAAFPNLRLFLREDTTARLVDRLNANRLAAGAAV